MHKRLLAAALLAISFHPVFGWSGFDVTESPLQLVVPEIPDIQDPSQPTSVEILVKNVGEKPIAGNVAIRDLADDWRVDGSANAAFKLAPGAEKPLTFRIVSGPFVFAALYPLHAYATLTEPGPSTPLHAVRIFKVASLGGHTPPGKTITFTPTSVPRDGSLRLWTLDNNRVAWNYFGKPPVYKSAGWKGSDTDSRANVSVTTKTRGKRRTALHMHPPWHPGGGTVFCDYLLTLPNQTPIILTFANAIRDHSESEPGSDGVLFRVWAGTKTDGSDSTPLFESFSKAKVWQEGKADLSSYAGKTILLRLESHPGPAQDTSCDSSYWAEPTVMTGTPPAAETTDPTAAFRKGTTEARDILGGKAKPDNNRSFLLRGPEKQNRAAVAVTTGSRGLLDGTVSVTTATSNASFQGFLVALNDIPVSRWPYPVAFRGLDVKPTSRGAAYIHHLEQDGKPVDLTLELRADGPGLRVSATCPERITSFCVGAWDRRATRVYYGHGYCVEDPKPFRAGFGGHNMASSHVACDFEGGLSVLQATDAPPNAFEVSPDDHVYALSTHMDSTITLVPASSAFACAFAYRPLYDKQAAPAVKRLAGRFCFDIWGGKYAAIDDQMQQMIDYGLTDSFLTVHNWQRWGYDYRLPDIYPPNPGFGTVEDLKGLQATCSASDIPWGFHDNYIDIYPDATDFSYRHVYFTKNGEPRLAWYNRGRKAQSYKFRPDHIRPFIKRNFDLIKQDLSPTHSFLDVFTSTTCTDYWDHDGNFHSSLETRKCWGEAFAYIRDTLGGDAPTTSEAGHDQLIGYLDGADAQWLELTSKPRRFALTLNCGDWERVPWFDAVNHHRFIQHGVGYSGRYQSGRSREHHGISSDDYLGVELLSGHALMVDAKCWGEAAVQKYYLAQDVARNLALAGICDVTFVDDDIHKQRVTWDNGTTVCVNRGESDWTVDGHTLPKYGFHVRYEKDSWSTVERRNGLYMESSHGPSGWYCNARTTPIGSRRLAIKPHVENFRQTGDRSFAWTLVWDAEESTEGDQTTFVHFLGTRGKDKDRIVFQDDHRGPIPTSKWAGQIRVERHITIPEGIQGDVAATVGLYGGKGRAGLQGIAAGEGRILLGTLHVAQGADKTTSVTLSPPPPNELEPEPEPRWNKGNPMVDFGFAATNGAFRIQREGSVLCVTPLPKSKPFDIEIRTGDLLGRHRSATSLETMDPGNPGASRTVEFEQSGGAIRFKHDGEAFAYRIRLKKRGLGVLRFWER